MAGQFADHMCQGIAIIAPNAKLDKTLRCKIKHIYTATQPVTFTQVGVCGTRARDHRHGTAGSVTTFVYKL